MAFKTFRNIFKHMFSMKNIEKESLSLIFNDSDFLDPTMVWKQMIMTFMTMWMMRKEETRSGKETRCCSGSSHVHRPQMRMIMT